MLFHASIIDSFSSNARCSINTIRDMSIHQRIRDGRLRLKMTEEQFGERVGVSRGAVQQWEKEGGTAPRRKNQPAVAALIGVTVSELMRPDNEPANIPVHPADLSELGVTLGYSFDDAVRDHPGLRMKAYRAATAAILSVTRPKTAGLPTEAPEDTHQSKKQPA